MNKFSNNELKSAGFRIKSGMTKSGESGRSMVEMLGVLAVIGVLSVAGIAGYTTAMRSYRTNEIVNAASMLYIMAMSQNAGNGPTANVGMSNIGESDPSGATLSFDATNKNIIITFNDSNDCMMALNKLGDKATDDCTNKKLTVTLGDGNTTTVTEEPGEGEPCEVNGQTKCNYTQKTLYYCSFGQWTASDSCGDY